MMDAIKPKKLFEGATIGIISPSSAGNKEKLYEGISFLENRGYKVRLAKHVLDYYNGYAGKDDDRASDINEFFADTSIDAIFCSRGGYGAVRILDKINYDIVKRNPKIFAGYSDITSLHLAFYEKCNLITFHAPMVSIDMASNRDIKSLDMMIDALSEVKKISYKNPDDTVFESMSEGYAEGILIGGNIAVMMSSFGTEYMPNMKDGKDYILYLEEIDEKPYKVDRFISTLFNSNIIGRSVKGIVVGDFINCDLKKEDKDSGFRIITDTLKERFSGLDIPVISNVRCGHDDIKMTIAHGAKVKIDTNKKIFETLDSVLL